MKKVVLVLIIFCTLLNINSIRSYYINNFPLYSEGECFTSNVPGRGSLLFKVLENNMDDKTSYLISDAVIDDGMIISTYTLDFEVSFESIRNTKTKKVNCE